MKTTELERTFLVKSLPQGLENCKKVEIEDIYVPVSSRHPVIRIRRMGNMFEITKKTPTSDDHTEHDEHTIGLTKREFESVSSIRGKRLVKTRYYYDVDGKKAEIDVFHGKLEGLVLADFEFGTREEMDSFQPPEFCLADVTREEFIAGGMLCGKSYQEIEEKLRGFGYQRKTSKLNPRRPLAPV